MSDVREPRGGLVRPVRPAQPIPPIHYPESLPVSGRRDEIARALRDHPVIIVCGETGSGKTTQLPKIALELGRGLGAGGKGLIGHTQPRRIAASSVAKRIADGTLPEGSVSDGVIYMLYVPGATVLEDDGTLCTDFVGYHWDAMANGAGLLAGAPIAEIEVDIRDHEVFVAGAHVNQGYLDPADDKSTKSISGGKLWHRTGDAARFNAPAGLASDAAGNLYVAESSGTIRKISPAGVVSTRATVGDIQPSSLASDASGNLYLSRRQAIIKLTTDGQLIGLAGNTDQVGSNDGIAQEARFNSPHSITLDPAGNLYITENNNHTVRKLSPGGTVTTFAGKSGEKGVKLGPLPGGLSGPRGIAFGLRHSQPALFVINWHAFVTPPFKGYTPTENNIVTIALP